MNTLLRDRIARMLDDYPGRSVIPPEHKAHLRDFLSLEIEAFLRENPDLALEIMLPGM